MDPEAFLSQNPVFTLQEFRAAGRQEGCRPRDVDNLLANLRRQRRVCSVRNTLYITVPLGHSPDTCPVDPYLLAAKIRPDAVLAYHTALEIHGKACRNHDQLHCVTACKPATLGFRSCVIRCQRLFERLTTRGQRCFGVCETERAGTRIRVTSLERTLVDVLNRPWLVRDWEETWQSLESIRSLELDEVVKYSRLLGNATTVARVGFFLEQHRNVLGVEDRHLKSLRKLRPRQSHYFVRAERRGGRFLPDWNLIVPLSLLERHRVAT